MFRIDGDPQLDEIHGLGHLGRDLVRRFTQCGRRIRCRDAERVISLRPAAKADCDLVLHALNLPSLRVSLYAPKIFEVKIRFGNDR